MRRSGPIGEERAARHLLEEGYELLARNWRAGRTGELDIVARLGATLVVVEVKTAAQRQFGDPISWVTPRKQAQIARLAEAFLAQYGERVDGVRFDVIAVDARKDPPELMHLADAFRPEAL